MAAEITRTYTQNLPDLRLIGKKYGDGDRYKGGGPFKGTFTNKWNQWFFDGWDEVLRKLSGENMKEVFEYWDFNVGFSRKTEGKFEYWIGYLTSAGTPVPKGLAYLDMPACTIGICLVSCKPESVSKHKTKCAEHLKAEGFNLDDNFYLERLVYPRYTDPDENGNVIADICFRIKQT